MSHVVAIIVTTIEKLHFQRNISNVLFEPHIASNSGIELNIAEMGSLSLHKTLFHHYLCMGLKILTIWKSHAEQGYVGNWVKAYFRQVGYRVYE